MVSDFYAISNNSQLYVYRELGVGFRARIEFRPLGKLARVKNSVAEKADGPITSPHLFYLAQLESLENAMREAK